jgi:hypothetical protein
MRLYLQIFALAGAVMGYSWFSTVEQKIDVNHLAHAYSIASNVNRIEFSRGSYVLDLEKKQDLVDRHYKVARVDQLTFTGDHQPSPEDAYSRYLVLESDGDQQDIAILPATAQIYDLSKSLKPGDSVVISGAHFQHDSLYKSGTKQSLGHCLTVIHPFYVTSLSKL